MKSHFVIILALGLAAAASAEVRLEPVAYEQADTTLRGWVAYDDAATGRRPGVIVVHEWWGLNDYTKRRARMLAEAGYVAFAADMYGDGKMTEHPQEASAWAGAVRENEAMATARFDAVVARLKDDPHVDPAHIAAIGYCFGGSGVLGMALGGADLDGVASFHGGLPTDTASGEVTASILVCHGAEDTFTSPEQIRTFQHNLSAAGADWEFIVYGRAKHSFTNPGANSHGLDGLAYDATADRRSWATLMDFLAEVTR